MRDRAEPGGRGPSAWARQPPAANPGFAQRSHVLVRASLWLTARPFPPLPHGPSVAMLAAAKSRDSHSHGRTRMSPRQSGHPGRAVAAD